MAQYKVEMRSEIDFSSTKIPINDETVEKDTRFLR